jgi:hypothetical protein
MQVQRENAELKAALESLEHEKKKGNSVWILSTSSLDANDM